MGELIGTPRLVGNQTVYDVMVWIACDVDDCIVSKKYPITIYPTSDGRWQGQLGILFRTHVIADTPRAVVKRVMERLTIGLIDENLEGEFEENDN
jgi:hypothetical protein